VFYLWEFGVKAQRDRQFDTTIQWDVDLLSGYDYEFVPNVAREPGTHHFGGLDNPELNRRLASWAPEAILFFGYKWKSILWAIAWARRHRIPLLFRGDSHFLGRGKPPAVPRFLLRVLYSQFRALLYVGAANRDYFKVLGVTDDRLVFAPHAVDHEHFNGTNAQHVAAAAELRKQLGTRPDTRVVLFAGKFVPAKQPLELLRAFLAVNEPNSALVFVGDGPEKGQLKSEAGKPDGRIHFLPFANQSEMPARYLLADLFVLPSRGFYETWGLAVNEAMHMGVPCLVSDRVGCQRDLVIPGKSGWVFPADDHAALTHTLRSALRMTNQELANLSTNARRIVAAYTYRQTTDGLLHALTHSV
jgi:glycosyltransferase involved in cell wall biosynthesis